MFGKKKEEIQTIDDGIGDIQFSLSINDVIDCVIDEFVDRELMFRRMAPKQDYKNSIRDEIDTSIRNRIAEKISKKL